MSRLLLILVLIALSAFRSGLHAGSVDRVLTSESKAISFETRWLLDDHPPTGFLPVRIVIKNATNAAHEWTVSSDSADGMGASVRFKQKLQVDAQRTGIFHIFIPRGSLASEYSTHSSVNLTCSGYGIAGGSETVHMYSSSRGSGRPTPYVAMSQQLATPVWSKLQAEIPINRSSEPGSAPAVPPGLNLSGVQLHPLRKPAGSARVLLGSAINPAEFPPDERAWSGVAGLWIAAEELAALSTDQRAALRNWVIGGGSLFIAHKGSRLPQMSPLPEPPADGQESPVGLGRIKSVALVIDELPVDTTVRDILGLYEQPFPPFHIDFPQITFGPTSNSPYFQVVGAPTLNVPALISFAAIFALLVGPINLFLLAPAGRRHRLFFTIPLLSAGACASLFGMIVIGDGVGADGARAALVYLPRGENRAHVWQEQLVRTRLLWSRDFTLPETAQTARIEPLGGEWEEKNILLRQGNQASGDWFRSRALHRMFLQNQTPTRASIDISTTGGASPQALSSIPGELRQVFHVDAERKWWRAASLSTGRPAPLQSTTQQEFEKEYQAQGALFSPAFSQLVKLAAERPPCTFAFAEAAPEVAIATLASIRWKRETILYIVEGARQP